MPHPFQRVVTVPSKAGSTASQYRYNRVIKSYLSEPVQLHILEIKIDAENSELPPFCRWGQLEISIFTMHCQNKAVRQVAHGLSSMMWNPNLALFCQSEIAIPCKMDWLEVHPIIKLHDFLSPCQFNIKNES